MGANAVHACNQVLSTLEFTQSVRGGQEQPRTVAAGGSLMALISFIKGANQGSSVELVGDKIILGRNQDCTVVLNVPAVSREHAVIRRIQGKFYIEDMKSRNGTFVNNKEVTTRTLLKDNDRLKICDNLLAYYEATPRPPLPDDMKAGGAGNEDEEDDSSTVEA